MPVLHLTTFWVKLRRIGDFAELNYYDGGWIYHSVDFITCAENSMKTLNEELLLYCWDWSLFKHPYLSNSTSPKSNHLISYIAYTQYWLNFLSFDGKQNLLFAANRQQHQRLSSLELHRHFPFLIHSAMEFRIQINNTHRCTIVLDSWECVCVCIYSDDLCIRQHLLQRERG